MTVFGIMYISVYRYNNFLAYLLQVLLKETTDDLELKALTGRRFPYTYLIEESKVQEFARSHSILFSL